MLKLRALAYFAWGFASFNPPTVTIAQREWFGCTSAAKAITLNSRETIKQTITMKKPLETLVIPASILMLAFFSALLLPAPLFGIRLAKQWVASFHLIDLNQLYTIIYSLWFLLLGTLEFFLIRWVWRCYRRH